ncbi:MAG: EAL domain-containing protein [Clostridiaceae bacterium]
MNKKVLNKIITFIVVSIIMFIIMYLMYGKYKTKLYNDVEKDIKNDANTYALILNKEFNNDEILIETTSEIIGYMIEDGIEDINSSKMELIKGIFETGNNGNNIIDSMYFVDSSSGLGMDASGIFNMYNKEVDLRKRDWYIKAVKLNNVYTSDVYEDINSNNYCFTISAPVFNNDRLIGVLACDIFFQEIIDYEEFISKSNLYKSYIFTADGKTVINNKFAFIDSIYNNKKDENYSFYVGDSWKLIYVPEKAKLNTMIRSSLVFFSAIGIVIALIIILIINALIGKYYFRDKISKLGTKYKLFNDISMKYINCEWKNILYVRLDNIQKVKNNLGNEVTDEVVRKYSKILIDFFDCKDNIYHTKYDEFLVLIDNEDSKRVEILVNDILNKFKNNEYFFSEDTLNVTPIFSLIKYNNKQILNFRASLSRTQEAIDKMNFGNEKYVYFSYNDIVKKSSINENKLIYLRKAIKEDRLIPFYQPILDIKQKQIKKYEVLMRIKDEEKFLAPYPYILIAEEYNFIDRIDLIILDKALKYKREIDIEDEIVFSFNLSVKVLNNSNYLKTAVEIIDSYKIKHESIIFEITETQDSNDIEIFKNMIEEYRKLGFKISIDDFGTGFSAIYYLKKISADYLKIDGSFIKDINDNEENYYLVKSIVNMAKAFNLKVVAEYVESEEILKTLEKLEIEYAQGYFVDKPQNHIKL